MTALHLKAHSLRNVALSGWSEQIAGRWHYRDLANDPTWRHGWISFDAVTYNPHDKQVYCGLNSIDGDLLYSFNPANNEFTGRNTQRWTDAFDSKIHRTLLLNPADDCFYFATSLLHDADQQHEAPGGKLVRYDWKKDIYTILTIPFPHLYVQSIALDPERQILYGFTYPAEFVFRFDLSTGSCRTLAYVGNAIMFAQPHNAVVDRNGYLWGTYAETRAWDENLSQTPIRLFKYHPDDDKFQWLTIGLARKADRDQLRADPESIAAELPDLSETRHRQDFGFCDSMLYDGQKFIYAGSVAGVLSRIDVDANRVDKVATVMGSGRFPAMALGPDGLIYGGGGMKSRTTLCKLDPHSLDLSIWDSLSDPDTDQAPARIHEICVGSEGTVFLAENDNHLRSSYLWSASLPA